MGIGRFFKRRDIILLLCQKYCNYARSENNDNIRTNGELNFLKKHLPVSRVVFDVGANIGEWAELALRINPSAEIHCFEPIKHNFAELSKKKWPPQVTLLNCALSSECKEQDIYTEVYSLYKREGLMARYGIPVPSKLEKVQLSTVDAYCKENNIKKIDLLKMDIEGHEFCALQGAINTIRNENVLRIQIEYGGTDIASRVMLKDFFDFFVNRPYSFFLVTPRRLEKIPEYDVTLENFQYKNFVILHHSIESN